jgi:hypothetical protein
VFSLQTIVSYLRLLKKAAQNFAASWAKSVFRFSWSLNL